MSTDAFPAARNFRLRNGWSFETALSLPEAAADNAVVGSTGAFGPAVFLGKLAEYQGMRKNVWIDLVGAHSIYVMGKRRSGKSYTLGVLIESLCGAAETLHGSTQQAVVVFDTMNVFLTAGSPGAPGDIDQRWGLSPARVNCRFFHPAGTNGPIEIGSVPVALRASQLSLEDWCGFFDLDVFSDPIAFLIGDVIQTLSATPTTRADEVLYSISDMVACAQNISAQYDPRTVEACVRRLRSIERSGIFDPSAGHIADMIAAGQGSILFLRDIEQEIRSLFVAVFVRTLMANRSETERYERLLGRPDTEGTDAERTEWQERVRQGTPRTWIVIDEAHNYLPSRGQPPSRKPLKRYIDEGRNLGLSIVVATQQPAGLDGSIVRNADMLLFHSMTAREDIDAAAQMVNSAVPETVAIGTAARFDNKVFERLVRSLPRGYCVVSSDEADRIFPIAVRPRVSFVGGADY
jgi:hypothetical protein